MAYRRLGSSGLQVSDIALGTMIFGEDSQRSTPEDEAIHIIQRYLDMGGNHIDTANVYAHGRSEEIVGRALRGRRDQVVLATKVRFPTGKGPNDAGLSRYHINHSVENSLRRLQTGTIDILYMHCWDPLASIAESLRACEDLVSAGKVLYIGVSNFKAWQVMKALGISRSQGWMGFVAAQYQYSLVMRDIELEFTDLLAAEGVGLVPWGPLGGGFLSGKYQPERRPTRPGDGRLAVMPAETEEAWERRATARNWLILQKVSEIAAAHDATQAQVAIAWLLQRPEVSSVVVGVRTLSQLDENLAGSGLVLRTDEIEQLDRVSKPEKPYPYRFIEHYGMRS